MSVTAADLAWMQSSVTGLRPTPCTISRYTSVADGWGGTTETWANLATTTCRVMASTQTVVEQVEEARPVNNVRWTIAFAAGTDVTKRDRIIAQGITYEVTAVMGPKTNEIERLVQCVVLVV